MREKLLRNPIFDEIYIFGGLKEEFMERRKLPGPAIIRNSRLAVEKLMQFSKIIVL
jgi:hypothetical protein